MILNEIFIPLFVLLLIGFANAASWHNFQLDGEWQCRKYVSNRLAI